MRVLLINYELPPIGAGAGNATHHIARHLALLGDEVLVLTSRFALLPREEARDGYRIRRVPAVRRRADRSTPLEMTTFLLGGVLPALDAARSFRPEVACAFFTLPSGPLTWLLRRLHGVPYLVSLRGGDVPGFLPEDLGRFHAATAPLIRAIWRGSAGLVANSDGLAELARRSDAATPLEVIPNGVDLEEFSPPERDRPAHPLRLLLVGRLVRQKGARYLIEALSRVESDVVLRIVGDGPERAALAEQARTLGVADRVELAGWAEREQLPGHYRWADVFVLPSFEEGMPNAVLEALSSGLAIITTDVYGNRALVDEGNGIRVEPGDAASIAAAINRLGADPAGLRALGRRSRERALEHGWERVAKAYRSSLELAREPAVSPPAPPPPTPSA